jgi:superfamily II DNA or RNA helicase
MQCGAIRYQVNAKAAALERPFEHIIIPRSTKFSVPESEEKVTIQQIYQYLSENEDRNNQIVSDVISSVRMGRSPLLLTERVSHLKTLADKLSDKVENIIVLHGGMGNKQLKKIREQLETIDENEERVILATGKYIGEGFDDPRLDTLFLAMPISWKGTLQQYAGRLHRLYDSKKEVRIYDYVDDQVEMLQRMYTKRKSGYRAMGYLISDNGNSESDMFE